MQIKLQGNALRSFHEPSKDVVPDQSLADMQVVSTVEPQSMPIPGSAVMGYLDVDLTVQEQATQLQQFVLDNLAPAMLDFLESQGNLVDRVIRGMQEYNLAPTPENLHEMTTSVVVDHVGHHLGTAFWQQAEKLGYDLDEDWQITVATGIVTRAFKPKLPESGDQVIENLESSGAQVLDEIDQLGMQGVRKIRLLSAAPEYQ